MENLQLVCNESRVEDNQNIYGRFKLFPFVPGQAVTLVNGLRRCLLSEVSGLAITAIKIKGVKHEYSTIVGVRESVLDLLLNVKQVVLTSEFQFEQPQVAYLRVQGPGRVRASDIKLPMSIQNVKPEQYIATLLYDGVLDIKFIICRGKNSLVQTPRGLRTPKVLKTKSPHQFNVLQSKANHIKFNNFLNQNINNPDLLKTNRLLFTTAFHTFLKQKHKKKIKPYADLVFLRLETEEERQLRLKRGIKKNFFGSELIEVADRIRKNDAERMETNIMEKAFLDAFFLPIDAVFAPVLRVNFAIEENDLSNAPKECVILEIWTNGSIHPIQAIVEAGKALTNITSLLKPITLSKPVFINSLKSFNKALTYNQILKQKEQKTKYFKSQQYHRVLVEQEKYLAKKAYQTVESVLKNQLQEKYLAKKAYQTAGSVLKNQLKDRDKDQQELFKVFTLKYKPRSHPLNSPEIQSSEVVRRLAIRNFLFYNFNLKRRSDFELKSLKRFRLFNKVKFVKDDPIKTVVLSSVQQKYFLKTQMKSYVKNHFFKMGNNLSSLVSVPKKIDFSVDIGHLNLSLRSYTCLKKAKIENLSDLLQNSAEDLLNLKGFGKDSLNEVENSLHQLILKLKS